MEQGAGFEAMETRHLGQRTIRASQWARRLNFVAASSALALLGCYLYSDWKHRRNPYGERIFAGVALSQLPKENNRHEIIPRFLKDFFYRDLKLAERYLQEGLDALRGALLSFTKDACNGKLLLAMSEGLRYLKIAPLQGTPKG